MRSKGCAALVSLRLFFALEPDEATRTRILELTADARARSRGRAVASANLHLTLAFLGFVEETQVARIESIEVDGAPFSLLFDRVGYWPRTRITWLGMAATPAPLQCLFDGLWEALVPLGFERDKHPFRPHITLARKAGPPGPALLTEALSWRVEDITLMHSAGGSGGVVYKALKRWPLAGDTR